MWRRAAPQVAGEADIVDLNPDFRPERARILDDENGPQAPR